MSTFEHRIAERRRPEATGESGRPAAAARARPSGRESQRQLVQRLRRESVLDRSLPLGMSSFGRPEIGPTPAAYYREKHLRGERGAFYPLHWVAP
jgi:hypothetical protein